MGHAIQMRREGIKPSWMLFIPFLGAAVGARSLGGNALAEARIGLAGPILILFLLLGAMESWRRWKGRRDAGDDYRVPPRARLLVAVVYVGLIAACAIGMDTSFVDQSHRL
jgi:hypothetical protein